jgi:hypothetical protein
MPFFKTNYLFVRVVHLAHVGNQTEDANMSSRTLIIAVTGVNAAYSLILDNYCGRVQIAHRTYSRSLPKCTTETVTDYMNNHDHHIKQDSPLSTAHHRLQPD